MMNADKVRAVVEMLQEADPTLRYDIDYDLNFMNEDELNAVVAILQEANPMLRYDIDYDNIDKRYRIHVNGIAYLSDEYWELKYPRKSERPTIVEKRQDKVWWTKFTMEFMKKTNAIMRLRKSDLPKKVQAMILAKRVEDREQATIVQDVPPIKVKSETSQAINILPATPAPELKFIIAPKALPNTTWKIFDEPPTQVVATSKGDHQPVTSKGGQVYRGKPGQLKGCAGRILFQDVQPASLLGISDGLAIGLKGVG